MNSGSPQLLGVVSEFRSTYAGEELGSESRVRWLLLVTPRFLVYLVIFNYVLDIVGIVCGFGRGNFAQRTFMLASSEQT